MRTSRSHQILLGAKIIAALVTLAAAMALVGQQSEFWAMSAAWNFAVQVVPLVLGFFAALGSAARQAYVRSREVRREKVGIILRGMAFTIQDDTAIDVRDIGTAAYLTQPWWHWPFFSRKGYLQRIARERPKQTGVSTIRWRSDVGVVGICVALGKDVVEDIALLDDGLGKINADEWVTGPESLGLTYDEFQKVRDKFAVVLASPIIVAGKAVGCVAVDGPVGSYDKLEANSLRGIVAAAADEIVTHVLT